MKKYIFLFITAAWTVMPKAVISQITDAGYNRILNEPFHIRNDGPNDDIGSVERYIARGNLVSYIMAKNYADNIGVYLTPRENASIYMNDVGTGVGEFPWSKYVSYGQWWYVWDLVSYRYPSNYTTFLKYDYRLTNFQGTSFASTNIRTVGCWILSNEGGAGKREDRTHYVEHFGPDVTGLSTSHLTDIGRYAFSACRSLTNVEFGPNLRTVGEFAFYACTALEWFTVLATDAPTTDQGVFYESNARNANLVVPVNCVSKYRNHSEWGLFGTIMDVNGRRYDDATAVSLNDGIEIWLNALNTPRQLVCTTTPSVAGSITWSSSDTKVITVSNTGVATAVGRGKATVTVRTVNGLTASIVVNSLSEDATLRSLQTGSASLSPAFHPDTLNYRVTVPYTMNNITLTAVRNDNLATVTGDGDKALQLGDNPFSVHVSAQYGNRRTYNINIRRQNNEARLQSLAFTPSDASQRYMFVPDFDPDITDYVLYWYNYTGNLVNRTISYEPADTAAQVSPVTTEVVRSVELLHEWTVTAEDPVYKRHYSVREYHNPGLHLFLQELHVSGTDIADRFNPAVENYTDTVGSSVSTITLSVKYTDDPAVTVSGADTYSLDYGTNTFEINLSADNGNTLTYHISIRRKSTDASLRSLQVDPGTIPFSPDTYSYYLTVPYSTDHIALTAECNHESATLDGDGIHGLTVGENHFPVTVTAEDGNQTVYTVTVYRKSNEIFLRSLQILPGTLSPAFDAETLNYRVTVPCSVSSISIEAEKDHEAAKLYVTSPWQLAVGDNTIPVTVMSGAGDRLTYTVSIHRQSNDTTLRLLQVNGGALSPAFDRHVFTYHLTVPEAVDGITLTAECNHDSATHVGGGTHALTVGDNSFPITVTAEDNNHGTYTVNIHRQSSDATLAALRVGVEDFDFRPEIFDYYFTVSYLTDSITLVAEKHHSLASVAGDGRKRIAVGDTVFPVVVTAEEGNRQTYTVYIHKQSSDATLRSLQVNAGRLSPEFNPAILNYQVFVPHVVDNITIGAEPNDPAADVTGGGDTLLQVGDNVFPIVVTSEINEQLTYTVNIRRQSNDATLCALRVAEADIAPSFTPDVTDYTVTVPASTPRITLEAEPNDTLAAVAGTGPLDLSGVNGFNITVTAEDGSVGIYTVTVIRVSEDATLKSLSVSSGSFLLTMNPPFNADVSEYEVSLPHNLPTVITVKAETNHSLADVTGDGLLEVPQGDHVFQVNVTAEYGNHKTYELNVIRVSPTGLRENGEAVRIYVDGGVLHIHTPVSERIEVYSVSGLRLYASEKAAGEIAVALSPAAGVWIVRGSSGWVRKELLK